MIIPVRCFTCGKVVGNKYEKYLAYINEGKSPEYVFMALGCACLLSPERR